MQSLPLSSKIRMTEYRIRQWYEEFDGNVYVSFSGGKDSTVLLHIARKLYPDIEAVFVNTGLEYPSVRNFALSHENVRELHPAMNFRDVIIKYGYPIVSKKVAKAIYYYRKGSQWAVDVFNGLGLKIKEPNEYMADRYGKWKFLIDAPFEISDRCCGFMKEKPLNALKKKAISALLAEESTRRLEAWLKTGCNSFTTGMSKPMSFWTENDVLTYIHENNLPIAKAYGKVVVENKGIDGQINLYDMLSDYQGCKFCTTGCKRTGCIFCLFGITQDLKRILRLQKDEPKLADYVLRGGEFGEDGMWRPDKHGMGYWFVLDWLAVHNIKVPYENAESYREMYGSDRAEKLLKVESG